MKISKPRICFVDRDIYKILRPELGIYRGMEIQQFIIANKLKELGYPVTFLTYDYGQPQYSSINDFHFIKTSRQEEALRFTRLSNWNKLFLLWKALGKSEADIYYQCGNSLITGMVSLFCKVNKKKFIFWVAFDPHIDLRHIYNTMKLSERYCYFYGIRNADAVKVQTDAQKLRLEQNFNVRGIKISDAIPISNYSFNTNNKEYILWAGVGSRTKQPQLVIELAKKFPQIKFIVLGFTDKKIAKEVIKIAPNIECPGFIPYPKNLDYYDKAYFLINTSLFEGFPGTFLEAWDREVPVISLTIDPDECICKYKLGFHSGTFDNMVAQIKLLLEDENLRTQMGKNGRKYVEQNHNIDNIIYKYINLFKICLNKD